MARNGDERFDPEAYNRRAARLNEGLDRDWGFGRVVLLFAAIQLALLWALGKGEGWWGWWPF